ncbi:hypothetical protein K439DRAFT_404376 [Ramaria rubella]|nr:hypothetical protein K439DRAFT_404376 [Ramaria rubella]
MSSASSQHTRQHRIWHENQLFFQINQLPEDIIRQIFETTQNYWNQALSPPSIVQRRMIAAFRLSHVCQKWRRISQDDALLWTDIDTRDMDLANRCLALCKDAPIQLILRGNSHRRDIKPVIELLQHHLYHVRDLYFRFRPDDILRVLHALPSSTDWDQTAPILSAIAVQPLSFFCCIPSVPFEKLGASMATLPIFTHSPHQLLDISFDYVTPPASSPIWNGRQKLTFWQCSNPQRSVSDYLELIARSPNLTCLTICSGLSISTPSFVSHVTLCHLTELTISGWHSTDVISFLNCLIIPKIKELTIHVLDYPSIEPCPDLLRSLHRSLNFLHEIRVLKIGPRWSGPECVRNMRLPPQWATWTGSCSNSPDPRITVTVPFPNERKVHAFTDILSLFPQLHSLILTNPSPRFTWDLGTSHSVQVLQIEGLYDGDQTCLPILEELVMRKCLPFLARLELVDITFLENTLGKMWSSIESLLGHSHSPTLLLSRCGFISQRDHEESSRSLELHKRRKFSKVTQVWDKLKVMTLRSKIRKMRKRQITGNQGKDIQYVQIGCGAPS